MALIDDVRVICRRLARFGWRDLILQATNDELDIRSGNLTAPIANVNRTLPGFADFCGVGSVAGLSAGSPARSLIYHALASPCVHPPGPIRAEGYPTLEELDTIENCIYALAKRSLKAFLLEHKDASVAMLAYQYRVADRTPHKKFADMAYSRIGVSRVGTNVELYDPARRSFRGDDGSEGQGIPAMPARYGAFLAVPRSPSTTDAILELQSGDGARTFYFPVHKLFPGRECFLDTGSNVQVDFVEFHRNEKLRRIHKEGGIEPLKVFNLDEPPFVRDSHNTPDLITLRIVGASVLVVPAHNTLARTATQKRSGGVEEIARFKVPHAQPDTRFSTSLQIEPDDGVHRLAPEYVNIRHEVTFDSKNRPVLKNISLLPAKAFRDKIRLGGYLAAHFIDDTCDGALLAKVSGLVVPIPAKRQVPAYSLVTAPDFFPLADQVVINQWAEGLSGGPQSQFAQGGPEPLSRGRMAANLTLPRPGAPAQLAFDVEDNTVAAVIAVLDSGAQLMAAAPAKTNLVDASSSFLPDAASNVFAPGWDVSLSEDEKKNEFYAAYGLGSPFPEDAKLCAALNSFWPAVAPDAARTFGWIDGGMMHTAIPLLDVELGLHPNHPAVSQGSPSRPGWDGEYGPFFETINNVLMVNLASAARSDYTANALAGLIRTAGLEKVDNLEMIARMEALRACIRRLPPQTDAVSTSRLFMVTAEAIGEWSTRGDRGDVRLRGPGFRFVFARLQAVTSVPGDLRRVRAPLEKDENNLHEVFTCQIGVAGVYATALAWQKANRPFNFVLNP